MINDLKTGGQTPTPRTAGIIELLKVTWKPTATHEHFVAAREGAKHGIEALELKLIEAKSRLAAHAEDRAMLETLRENNAKLERQLDAAFRAGRSMQDEETNAMIARDEALAQLDAARRERDEANAELDRAKGLIVRALDSAETHSENTRTAIAGIAKLQSAATARMAELAALRAELEAKKAQLDSYRTHTL